MDFSILKHWVENRQLLCRFSLSLFQALGSWGRARGGDSLGSWGRAKKAGERGKNVGDCLGSRRRAKKSGERDKNGDHKKSRDRYNVERF